MTIVMKQSVAASEFKAKCLRLLDEVDRTRKEVVITKRGRAVARLVPIDKPAPVVFGRMKGTGEILGDIVGPLHEVWNEDV